MKTSTLLLIGAGVVGYVIYTRKQAAAAAPVVAPAPTAGALGAVMTGNSMMQELGSLGIGKQAWKGTRGY